MTLSRLLLASIALPLALSVNAGTNNYFEYGFGASQIHSLDKEDNKGLKDQKIGGTAKLLIGGRLSRSANSWFELGAAFSDRNEIGETTFSSQVLLAGFKFTTDPRKGFSSFLRVGGGKTFNTEKTSGEAAVEERFGTYYLGTGFSFRLDTKQAVNLEFQRFGEEGEDRGLNTFYITFNQFL